MRLHLLAPAALALLVPLLGLATAATSPADAPSAHNSGAGIAGQPGGKNGPAVNSQGQTQASANQTNATVAQQDSSKIKGKPGGESGPATSSGHSKGSQ